MKTFKALFSSRKFLAALVNIVVVIAGKFGLELDAAELAAVSIPFVLYILGTAWEDAAAKHE